MDIIIVRVIVITLRQFYPENMDIIPVSNIASWTNLILQEQIDSCAQPPVQ